MGSIWMRSMAVALTLAVGSWINAAFVQAQSTTNLEPTLLAFAPETSRNVAVPTDVLNIVPDNALYLVVASNVADTKETVENVLRKLNVPFETDEYKEFNDFVTKLEGWDKKGMHALAFLPDTDGDITPAFFVPVTDYKKFAKSVGADPAVKGPTEYSIEDGPDGLIAEKGTVAVLVAKGHKDLLERIVASNAPIAKNLSPLQAFMGRQQIAAIMLPTGLKKGVDTALGGLELIKGQAAGAGPQAATLSRVFEVYGNLLKTARDEMSIVAAGVHVDESKGVDVALHAVFKVGGKVFVAAQNIAPLPAQPLKGLPDGEFVVAGAGVFPGELTKSIMEFSLGLASELPPEAGGYNLTPEQTKEMIEISQQAMAGLKRASFSMGATGVSIYDSTSMLFHTDDANKFMANYEKSMSRMAEVIKKNPATTYPMQEIKHKMLDGRDTLVVTMDMSKMIEKQTEKQPQLKGMMENMFGKDGKMTLHMATVDKESIVMAYSEDGVKQAIADLKSGSLGLAGNEHLQKTAVMLNPRAQWIAFVSVGGYLELIKKFMAAAAPPGAPGAFPFQIPAFPATAPIGFSAQVAPTALEAHVVVPMSLMESVRDFVQQMRAQFGGAM